jgi:hypothetical protein
MLLSLNEDLRKAIPALLTDIHQQSLDTDWAELRITRTIARFASLLGVLYIRAETQTQKVLNLTKQLVWLTVALAFLTAVLLIFTIYLSYDAYLNDQ